MAMDRQHRRLFIGGRNPKLLVVMDADNGKIVGQPFPIGDRVDTNVYDPETRLVACSTGEGTIHVFHEDSPDELSVVETVKTEFGAKTMALDRKLTISSWTPRTLIPRRRRPRPSPIHAPGLNRE